MGILDSPNQGKIAIPNTVVIFGTSITNQNSQGVQFAGGTTAKGYWAQASVQLGHRLKCVYNGGVSGNNSAQMLARIQTDVLAYRPGWCIVESGTPNDIGNGFTLAQSIANHKTIYDTLKAAGIRVVLCSPLPYGLNDTTANRQFVAGFRKWQVVYAREQGHVFVDWLPTLSTTDGTGLFKTGYSDGVTSGQNGIHPTSQAALAMGTVLANVLKPLVPDLSGQFLPASNADPYNLLSNGLMTGTGGSTMPAGVTGQLATSWTAFNNGGTSAGTLSKVARTDNIPGEWQQFTGTSGNTDAFKLQQQNTSAGTAWNIGDTVVAVAEFQADQNWTASNGFISLAIYFYGNGGQITDLTQPSGESSMLQAPASGILKISGVIPTGTTRVQVNPFANVGTGTVRWGRVGLYNLTALQAAGVNVF